MCSIQKGERRLENLKKHNWNRLVVCAKYELRIVSESTRHRQKRKEREAKQHTGQALMELGKEQEAAQAAEKSERKRDSGEQLPEANPERSDAGV